MTRLTGWQRALYARCSETLRSSYSADISLANATKTFGLNFLRLLLCHPALAKRYLQNTAKKWSLAPELLSLFEAQDLSILKRDQLLALHKHQVDPSTEVDNLDDLSSKLCVLRSLLTGMWAKAHDDKVVIFSNSFAALHRIEQMLHNMGEDSVTLRRRMSFAKKQVSAHACVARLERNS